MFWPSAQTPTTYGRCGVGPEGWTSEAAELAGVCANPWYCCFSPTSWLDQWGDAGTGGELARNWEQGRTVLGKLSAAAVAGCRMVWREATRLWSEGQRAEERQRRHHATATRAHAELIEEVALCRSLPNLGAHNFLVQKHYAAGVCGLLAECDRLRSKRQRTRSEREVLRWRGWTMTKVVGW